MASDIYLRFHGDAGSAVRASSQVAASIEGVDVAAAGAGRSLTGRLGGALAGFAKVGIVAAAGVSAAFAGMTIFKGAQRAIAIDDAETKLKGLGYTAQEVASITDNALKAVLGTPYSLAEAMTVASSALAAGIKPGKELQRYLGEVADTATIAGTNLGDVGQILNGVIATQRVYTDDLNSLAQRGLPVFSWLQKQYDVSGAKLHKMVSEGKVDAETLLRVIRDNIGGAAQKAGDSIRGSFANLMTAIARLGDAFLGPAFGSVPRFLQSIRGQVDDLTEHVKPIGEALGRMFRQIQNADGLKAKISVVFDTAKGALSDLIFGQGTQRTRVPIEGGRFEWQFHDDGGLVDAISKGIEDVDWSKVVTAIATGLISAAGDAASRFAQWASTNVTPENFIRLIGLDPHHNYEADIDRFLRRQLRGIEGKLTDAFTPNFGAAGGFFREQFRPLTTALSRLPGAVRGAFNRSRAAISGSIGSWAAAAKSLGARVVSAVVDGVKTLPGKVGAFIHRTAVGIGSNIADFASNARALGQAIVSGIVSGLGGLISAVGSAIASKVHSAIDWAKDHVGSTAEQYAQIQLGHPIAVGIAKGVTAGQPLIEAALGRTMRVAIQRIANRGTFDQFSQLAGQVFSGRQSAAQTPAERQIAAIQRSRQIADLNSALAAARASGDPTQVARAQEDIRLFQLEEQAVRQRATLEQRQFLSSMRFQQAMERVSARVERRLEVISDMKSLARDLADAKGKDRARILAQIRRDEDLLGGRLSNRAVRRLERRLLHEFNINVNVKGKGLSRADRKSLGKEIGGHIGRQVAYVVEAG